MLLLQCIRRRYPDAFYTMGNECKQTQTEKKLKKPNRPDTQEMCTQEFIRRAKTYIEMPELKQELLRQFKSIQAIRQATLPELERLLPKDAAAAVYSHFQNTESQVDKCESLQEKPEESS